MTENTKSFIKSTILGLLGGGTASALYAMHSLGEDKNPDQSKDEIVVPLSKSHFMKSVRGAREDGSEEPEPPAAGDAASMSPRDLAALKKALLRKRASDKCLKVNATESVQKREVPVRRIAGAGSTFPRDRKGRFVAEKDAGVFSDAGGTVADSLGWLGGTAAGLAAVKLVSDRIRINKKKRQVEESRRRYIDTLSKEVNDVDAPYYSKTAADRSLVGSTLGLLGLSGLVTGGVAGIVMYRIMENRRKELEKAKDKDLSSYPKEKTIKFKFPDTGYDDSGFFRIEAPAPAKAAPRTSEKRASVFNWDKARYRLFSSIPDWLVPSDFKGRLVIDSYLNSPKRKGGRTPLENRILNVPGTRSSIVNYLSGRGKSKIPDIVGKHFDGKWYGGPAKLLAKTHLADNIIIDKILDDIAPSLQGSKDLAKSFIYAGGVV